MSGGGEDALAAHLRELKAAKAEFEHKLRRLGDAAERAGGVLGASEAEVHRLRRNLKATDAEIARIEKRLPD